MTVQTTSVGTVIDALLKMWRALNLTIGGEPVAIFDGLPTPDVPDNFVQIGGLPGDTAEGTQEPASLGTVPGQMPARDEKYVINCAASCYVGGVDAESTTGAQTTARNNALSIVQALEVAVRNDPYLSTVLGGTGIITGWISWGGDVRLYQTDPADPEQEKGRTATFVWQIAVFKRLYSA